MARHLGYPVWGKPTFSARPSKHRDAPLPRLSGANLRAPASTQGA